MSLQGGGEKWGEVFLVTIVSLIVQLSASVLADLRDLITVYILTGSYSNFIRRNQQGLDWKKLLINLGFPRCVVSP